MSSSLIDFGIALDAGIKAAHAGASVLQAYSHRRADLIIDHKARNDLVSQADKEAEQAILETFAQLSPQFGIVAEETGGKPEGAATWYIDPLDGTTNYLHGIPHYAVSLGLIAHAGTILPQATEPLTRDTPVVAIVYDPNREELFTAVAGTGAWLNGQRIACSKTAALADSLLATGFPFRDFSFADQYTPIFDTAIHSTRGLRRNGSAALDLAWVACGRFDGYFEMGLAPWDVAAGALLVREAQGRAEDMYGQDPWPINGYVVASGNRLFPALSAIISPHLKPR